MQANLGASNTPASVREHAVRRDCAGPAELVRQLLRQSLIIAAAEVTMSVILLSLSLACGYPCGCSSAATPR